jgi:hypothetical protein
MLQLADSHLKIWSIGDESARGITLPFCGLFFYVYLQCCGGSVAVGDDHSDDLEHG